MIPFRPKSAIALFLFAALVAGGAAQAQSRKRVVVVPVGGAPIARDVANELESAGIPAELAPAAAPSAPALEPAKACVAAGKDRAFKLEYAAAIATLSECAEKNASLLARPEGIPIASALYTELAAAELLSGNKPRAKESFARMARLFEAVAPDPSVYTPDVVELWEETRRVPEASRPVTIESLPAWATVFVDGQRVASGSQVSLAAGAHAAAAEAPGFMSWTGVLVVDAETARLPVKLIPLEAEARHASVRAGAATVAAGTPGFAEELAAAFAAPVVLVAKSGDAVLAMPGENGGKPQLTRIRPPAGPNPGRGIAESVTARLRPEAIPVETPFARATPTPGRKGSKNTAYWIAGGVVGVVAAGAAAAYLASPKDSTGSKSGTVTWNP